MTAVDPLVTDLRQRREKAGLSQRTLAEAMGTVQSHVCELETGQVDPQLATLRRWAQALGLQPGWLPLAYETAPVERCTPAGNGAAEGGLKSPPDAPAFRPVDVGSGGGRTDVALVHGTWPTTGTPTDEAVVRATVDEFDVYYGPALDSLSADPAEARTLDVVERTVEKARPH